MRRVWIKFNRIYLVYLFLSFFLLPGIFNVFENPITLITATFFCISNHVYTLITFQHHIKQFLYISSILARDRKSREREREREYDNFIRVPTLSKIKFFFLSFISFFFFSTRPGERLEETRHGTVSPRKAQWSESANKQANKHEEGGRERGRERRRRRRRRETGPYGAFDLGDFSEVAETRSVFWDWAGPVPNMARATSARIATDVFFLDLSPFRDQCFPLLVLFPRFVSVIETVDPPTVETISKLCDILSK